MPLSVNHHPVFRLPDNSDDPRNPRCPKRLQFIRQLCLDALPKRYGFNAESTTTAEQQSIIERLEHELEIIRRRDWLNYFLIVWDIVRFARERGIPVGPGRGVSGSSIVSHLLGITSIAPLRHGLDFDCYAGASAREFWFADGLDFSAQRRNDILDYIRNKYGAERACLISTYNRHHGKTALCEAAAKMKIENDDIKGLAFFSESMKEACRKVGIDCFNDIAAVAAMYQPGLMDLIDIYAKRKKGLEKVEYLSPSLKPVLEETYGLPLYKEQVVKVKKIVGNPIAPGFEPERSHPFKAHILSSALLTCQTAHLKAHHPDEFMTATLNHHPHWNEVLHHPSARYFES